MSENQKEANTTAPAEVANTEGQTVPGDVNHENGESSGGEGESQATETEQQ